MRMNPHPTLPPQLVHDPHSCHRLVAGSCPPLLQRGPLPPCMAQHGRQTLQRPSMVGEWTGVDVMVAKGGGRQLAFQSIQTLV